MKTLLKIIIVITLFSLGGCYTQIALRDTSYKDRDYREEVDEYAYEDQADTTYTENEYEYDNYYNSYRRYLWSYYPSFGFGFGYSYYPEYYSLFGWRNPFWYWGYDPWYWWGYYPWRYNYGNDWYWNGGYHFPGITNPGNVKYRDIYARSRENDGQRGRNLGGRFGSGGDRGRTNPTISNAERSRTPREVDLGRARVSRDGSRTKETVRANKENPRSYKSPSTENTTRNRDQGVRDSGRNSAPQTRDREATRGRSESNPPQTRERTSPSYNPSPSYSPGSSSGRSSGSDGGSRSSGSDGGRSGSSSSDGGRKR
jgi:hypothetical protein